MKIKVLTTAFLMLPMLLTSAPGVAQASAGNRIAPAKATAAPKPAAATPALKPAPDSPAKALAEPLPSDPVAKPICADQPCDDAAPRVVVNVPPAPAAPWTWREQLPWGAGILLAVVGYIGVMMALALLKKIERQTRINEEIATAAADTARAALLHAQALIDSTRPWLLVTAEPTLGLENGFRVLVTNHGKSPARFEAMAEQMMICAGEEKLPAQPTFQNEKRDPQVRAIVLLPGESWPIRSFSRDEVKSLCESTEQFARVETWQEKIFLFGKVVYSDLADARGRASYETNWCCWYIHGQQKSGLVMAGPQSYHRHS